MKLTDRTDLRPETIALYQQLEAKRTACHPVLAAVGAVSLWPAVLMRAHKPALVLLFAGMLVGAANAWRSPAVLTGLALSPVAFAAGLVTSKSKKAAANNVVLSGTVLPIYHR